MNDKIPDCSPNLAAKFDYICEHVSHLNREDEFYLDAQLSAFDYNEVAYVAKHKKTMKMADEASTQAMREHMAPFGIKGDPPYGKALKAKYPNKLLFHYEVIQGSIDAAMDARAKVYKEQWYDPIDEKLYSSTKTWASH